MRVQVRLTARDFFAFARWYYWHNPTTWILTFVAASLGSLRSFQGMVPTGIELIGLVVSVAFMMLLLWIVLVIVGTVMLIVRNRRNTECAVDLTEEGIVEQMPHARLQIGWEAMRKPGVTRRYVFLRGLPNSIQLIPRRAFADDAAWGECVALVKRRTGGS